MQKVFSILIILIAAGNVVYSFFSGMTSASILTIEMNIWVYRLIWAVLAVFLVLNHFKKYHGPEAKDQKGE